MRESFRALPSIPWFEKSFDIDMPNASDAALRLLDFHKKSTIVHVDEGPKGITRQDKCLVHERSRYSPESVAKPIQSHSSVVSSR